MKQEENSDNKEKFHYGLAGLVSDIIVIGLVFLILEVCGCHICRFIGERVGDGVRAYHEVVGK